MLSITCIFLFYTKFQSKFDEIAVKHMLLYPSCLGRKKTLNSEMTFISIFEGKLQITALHNQPTLSFIHSSLSGQLLGAQLGSELDKFNKPKTGQL